jgi:hypothetical protein
MVVTVPFATLASDASVGTPRSAHRRPLGEALQAVAASGSRLPFGSFVGIGGRAFGFGVPMSIPVRAALPVFLAAIALEIDRLLRSGPDESKVEAGKARRPTSP